MLILLFSWSHLKPLLLVWLPDGLSGGTLSKSVYTNFFADYYEQACQTDTFD